MPIVVAAAASAYHAPAAPAAEPPAVVILDPAIAAFSRIFLNGSTGRRRRGFSRPASAARDAGGSI
jgi:hypothetical protein